MSTTTTVRDLTQGVTYTRTAGQFVETLSDGSCVALVKGDASTLYLYHSTNRSTWTLKNTISLAQPRVSGGNVGMCVDPNDNVNVYYLADMATDEFRYFRMAWAAGPTFTKSGEETITTEVSTTTGAADICYGDLIGARALVFVYINDDGASARKITYKVRTTAGAWGSAINFTLPNVGGVPGDVAIVRDQAGSASNLQKFAIIGHTNSGTTHILVVQVNINTGAASSSTTITSTALGGVTGQQRDVGVYCYANGEWTAVAIYGVGAAATAWAARFNSTVYTVQPVTKALGYVSNQGATRARTVGYTNGRPWVAYEQEVAGTAQKEYVYAVAAKQTSTEITWGEIFPWFNATEAISISSKVGRINDTQKKADILVQTSAIDGFMKHAYNDLPAAPTTVAPNGVTQVTNQPTLQIYVNSSVPTYGEWDVARDNTFTTDKKTVTQQIADFITKGTVSEQIPLAQQLDQSTWYIRGLTEDIFGARTAYSTTGSFVVSHPPTTINHTPKDNTGVPWAATNRLEWDFADTWGSDTQTAYEIVVVRDSDDLPIISTGKVVSTNQFYDAAIPSGNKGQYMRWTVAVWDSQDVKGPTSDGMIFLPRSAPSVVVTAPITSTNQPTPAVTWTYTPSAEGGVQVRWTVTVTDNAGGAVVYEATAPDNATSHSVANPLAILNAHNYTFRVTVVDEWGLTATDTETPVAAAWTPPAQPTNTVTTTSYATSGYVTVNWTDAVESASFMFWRVYRAVDPDYVWELIYETGDNAPTSFAINDYFVPEGIPVKYAVVQVTDVSGSNVESSYASQTTVNVSSGYYWLLDSLDSSLNFVLYSVAGDSLTEEQEFTEINLIGRGRKVERGTVWGYRGSLEAHLRGSPDGTISARQQRFQIEKMKRTNRTAYLRNPFGDVWAVNMGDVGITRVAGVGNREFSNLSIPYMEIS